MTEMSWTRMPLILPLNPCPSPLPRLRRSPSPLPRPGRAERMRAPSRMKDEAERIRAPLLWGVVIGGVQAASPVGFWWLDHATVFALELVLIAAVYIGFAVADGRWNVIIAECSVATVFVVVAAAAVTGSPWLLVVGYAGHGLKDLWQHRTRYVANTRWWPPLCLVVDGIVAAVIAVEIAAGVDFHH